MIDESKGLNIFIIILKIVITAKEEEQNIILSQQITCDGQTPPLQILIVCKSALYYKITL